MVVRSVECDLNGSWSEQEKIAFEPISLTVDDLHTTGYEIGGSSCQGDLHGREIKD